MPTLINWWLASHIPLIALYLQDKRIIFYVWHLHTNTKLSKMAYNYTSHVIILKNFKQHQVHGLLFRENALIWRFFLWDFLWENGHVDLQIFRWEPWDFPGFFRWNRGISWDFMWTYYEHGGFQWNFRPLRNCEETIIIPTKSGIAQRVPCETFL